MPNNITIGSIINMMANTTSVTAWHTISGAAVTRVLCDTVHTPPVNPHDPYANTRIIRKTQRHHEYDGYQMLRRILDAASIIKRLHAVHYYRQAGDYGLTRDCTHYPDADLTQHSWHKHLQDKFKLHPCVESAVMQYPPADWHQLLLEWPHVSVKTPTQIAYTRSEQHGREDRQTTTSVGKYLRRHFPSMPDHVLRDFVMRYGDNAFALWDTPELIIKSVEHGPRSCMQWGDGDDGDTPDHPYNCYAPEFGWRAAVRLSGDGHIVGRCLVNVGSMTFVRSYYRNDGGYSHSDEALEVWLRDQGYTKADNWCGLKLKRIDYSRGRFLAPYLDGNEKRVDLWDDCLYICDDGTYTCENTNGYACECDGVECPDCGDTVDDDDMCSTGYHGDHQVCRGCLDYSYTAVIGRRGDEYYIHQDEAVYVESEDRYYDQNWLSDNGIVELDNGEYTHEDNAVYVESRNAYFECDDEDVVYCENSSQYEMREDCVQLHDGEWALTDDAVELHDGEYALTCDATRLFNDTWALTDDCCYYEPTNNYYLNDDPIFDEETN